jgi:hypothetical protein
MSLRRRLDKLEATMHSGRNVWLFVRSLEMLHGASPAELESLRAELATAGDAPVLTFCRALLSPEVIEPYVRQHDPA